MQCTNVGDITNTLGSTHLAAKVTGTGIKIFLQQLYNLKWVLQAYSIK